VYRTHHGSVRRRTLRAALPELPPLPDDYTAFDYDGWDEGRTARWMRWLEVRMHLPRILMKVDRASMHHALEVRMPLLDREVVDVASRVDWATCLDAASGIGKRPLRHALARRVPEQTTAKRGFTVPIDAWFRGPLRPLFEDAVLGRAEICGVPLGRRALRAMHGEHQRGAARHGWLFWRLLSLALWAERHGRPTTT